MKRRTLLGAVGAGGVAMVAGCTSPFAPEPDGTSGERRVEYDDESVGPRARDEAAFDGYVASKQGVYGSMGVYGGAGADGSDRSFGGAWTQQLDHGDGVVSDHALVLHRLPPAGDGTPTAALWLWSALDPSPVEGATVERLSTGVDLPGDGAAMGIYDPGSEHRSDRTDAYTVETARKDVEGHSVSMPLPAGVVTYDPERTTVGDAGGFAPLWRGSHDGPVGLVATCEIEWPPATEQTLTWSMAARTTGI
jgi:hypothetical protein